MKVLNLGPLALESGTLPTVLCGPLTTYLSKQLKSQTNSGDQTVWSRSTPFACERASRLAMKSLPWEENILRCSKFFFQAMLSFVFWSSPVMKCKHFPAKVYTESQKFNYISLKILSSRQAKYLGSKLWNFPNIYGKLYWHISIDSSDMRWFLRDQRRYFSWKHRVPWKDSDFKDIQEDIFPWKSILPWKYVTLKSCKNLQLKIKENGTMRPFSG